MSMTIPFGNDRTKGKTIAQVAEADIKEIVRLGGYLKSQIADPNNRYVERNKKMLDECKQVLASAGLDPEDLPEPAQRGQRQGSQQTRQVASARSSAMAKAPAQQSEIVVGSFGTPARINEMLTKAQETSHLVSPATVCTVLPDGFDVVLSIIRVDPNTTKDGPKEVADVGGNLALSGSTLKRIAVAAGVSWDPIRSGRLDNGKDPLYCHYRAVGWARNFDNSPRCLMDEVEIDLREGSKQIDAMRERTSGNIDSQIRDMRLFILRHAITKAKLRAITDLGVKRSYTPKELQRDFQVARLMWTGRSDNPEVQRIFATKTAEAALSSMHTMFGAPPARESPSPLPALPVRVNTFAAPQGHDPPPVGASRNDEDPPDPEDYGDDDIGY